MIYDRTSNRTAEQPVLVTASPYGYGPASKAILIAERLAEDCLVVLAVDSSIADYVRRSCGPTIRVQAVDRTSSWLTSNAQFPPVAGLVSVHEPRACRWAQAHGIKSIFVDSLAFHRATKEELGCDPDLYVYQKFFSPPRAAFLADMRASVAVGPILFPATRAPSGDFVLANLGGMISPMVSAPVAGEYVDSVASILQNVGEQAGLNISLCIPAGLRCRNQSHVRVYNPSHGEFINLLRAAKAVVTVPGIESVLECLDLGLLPVFLPPFNGTQSLQEGIYRTRGIGYFCSRAPDVPVDDSETLEVLNTAAAERWRQLLSTEAPSICDSIVANIAALNEREDHSCVRDWLGRELGAGGAATVALVAISYIFDAEHRQANHHLTALKI